MQIRRPLGNWKPSSLLLCLAVVFCLLCARGVLACDQVPAGETFRARLLQPVSSYSSKAGSLVRAIVIESPQCNGQPIFPNGTLIEGHVESVHKVGLGLRHETATLEMQFDRIEPENGPAIQISARISQVDNAREQIKDGVIHGIRSNNAPQDHLSGRLGYLATWDPHTMLILPAYHAVFPVLPEPELYFPSGTDLVLQLAAPLPVANVTAFADPSPEFAPPDRADLEAMAISFPERTKTPKGRAADFVNLAFVGSAAQLQKAFQAAGWKRSEALSSVAAMREIDAWLMLRNYARGPMSPQLLQGEPSDSNWEKGLDSVAKRDHLRIWSTPETWKGDPIWLSAATKDVSASFSIRRAQFIHSVDPTVDDERERVVRDLSLAGCVAAVDEVSRPQVPHFVLNANRGAMITDGAIAVIQLKDCSNPIFKEDLDEPEIPVRPKSRLARYVRTQVLSARDLWRENLFYDAFSVTRASVRAIHDAHVRHENEEKQAIFARSMTEAKP